MTLLHLPAFFVQHFEAVISRCNPNFLEAPVVNKEDQVVQEVSLSRHVIGQDNTIRDAEGIVNRTLGQPTGNNSVGQMVMDANSVSGYTLIHPGFVPGKGYHLQGRFAHNTIKDKGLAILQ